MRTGMRDVRDAVGCAFMRTDDWDTVGRYAHVVVRMNAHPTGSAANARGRLRGLGVVGWRARYACSLVTL
jgi:hypothetical protein